MTLTLDQRKDRYYKLVLEKASVLYSSWVSKGILSKQIIARANEYAFSTKIKSEANYRFKVCVFIVALGIRIKKRYKTFFRRLFRIFSYFREKSALKMLKRILGYDGDTDIKEMLEIEIDKIAILLSNRNNDATSGGGKRIGKDDLTLDEEIDLFFEDCEKEDEKTLSEEKLKLDKESKLDLPEEKPLDKHDETEREKISVKEVNKEEKSIETKKESDNKTKLNITEKEIDTPKTSVEEQPKIEKAETKSVAETSILAETMVLGQDKEEIPSPFPVFRDNVDNNVSIKGKEDLTLQTSKTEIKVEGKTADNLNVDTKIDFDKEKNPFPVFNKGNGEGVQKGPDKPIEKEIKSSQEGRDVADSKDFKDDGKLNFSVEEKKYPTLEVSVENQVRRNLIYTMSDEQVDAMIDMIKESAKVEMERVEQEWREQISVSQDTGDVKNNVKPIESAPKNENIVTIPKK